MHALFQRIRDLEPECRAVLLSYDDFDALSRGDPVVHDSVVVCGGKVLRVERVVIVPVNCLIRDELHPAIQKVGDDE